MNLTWDERYAVGVRHLDDDHRDLIALANTLIGTVEQGADVEQARDALENLVELALAHFEAEERVLSECDYPDLREHILAHNLLLRGILKFRADLRYGRLSVDEAAEFIATWVLDHIEAEDQQYTSHLHRTGVH